LILFPFVLTSFKDDDRACSIHEEGLMSADNDVSSIADASKPNAGRIYDYFLGGNHNFEIDRKTAKQVLEFAPFLPKFVRFVRWFLGEATRRLNKEGFDKFLDFASGLPTVDHIHQITPKGTRVIYSDIDPVTVAYAQELVGEDSNIRYVQCDAQKPEILAIGFNGIAYFVPDDAFDHSMKVLYDWAEKGSKLFLCDADAGKLTDSAMQSAEIYKKMGQPYYPRSIDILRKIIQPWTIDEPGLLLLEDWIDMDKTVADEIRSGWGVDLYGVILKK
jgi:hypothetical protein